MAKEAYYFSHDSNARTDESILALRSVYGAEGYGWYWMLIEKMRDANAFRLQCGGKYDYHAIAIDLQCDVEKLKTFISDCINEFNLFESDGKAFWSNSLIRRMEIKEEKSSKAKQAAFLRWNKSNSIANASIPNEKNNADIMQTHTVCNANALQTHSDSNTDVVQAESERNAIKGKESKGKEIKGKEKKEKENKNKEVVAAAAAEGEEDSVFKKFISIYDEFIKDKTGGPAKLDGGQGKAANEIITYLRKRPKVTNDSELLVSWKGVLDNWENLEPFQRKKIKLVEIASDIIKIFDQLKNYYRHDGHKKSTAATATVSQGEDFGQL